MAQQTIQFRPLDLNDTISESTQLVISNALLFFGAMALANLPILIWQALVLTQPSQWTMPLRYNSVRDIDSVTSLILRMLDRFNAQLLASAAVSMIVGLLQSGAMTCVASRRYFGRKISGADAVTQATHRLPSLITGHVIPALVVIVAAWVSTKGVAGIIVCGVVLVVMYPLWLFVTPAVIVERLGGMAALRRSDQLAKRAYGHVLAVWLVLEILLFLATLVPFFLIGLVAAASDSSQTQRVAAVVFGNLAAFVIIPFREATITLLYYEMRRRKEGRASVLGDRSFVD